jgi:hypothetical protein
MNDFLMTVLIVFVATISFQSVSCIFVNIDANAEECFFDKVTSGTKMSLMFEVAEGGFLDIDIKVSYITSKYFIPFSNCQSADTLIGKYNSFTLYFVFSVD